MTLSSQRKWKKRLPWILNLIVVIFVLLVATLPHADAEDSLIKLSSIDIYGIETVVAEEHGIKRVRLPTENCTPLPWEKSKFRCDREIKSFIME